LSYHKKSRFFKAAFLFVVVYGSGTIVFIRFADGNANGKENGRNGGK